MTELNKKAPKIPKKELILVMGSVLIMFFGWMEFKIQHYSPFEQIMGTIYIPCVLIFSGLLWLFSQKRITDPKVNNLKAGFAYLLISAILTFPFLGFVSFTNRTLGQQKIYKLQGNIVKLDSIRSLDGTSDNIYNVELIEKRTNQKFTFDISQEEYRKLKPSKNFEKDLAKGFWGFIYEY